MTTVAASKWVRVNRRIPCPVCGKPDWCLISQDGKTAICARIESNKPAGNKGAGWIHTLDNSMRLSLPKPKPASIQAPKAAPGVLDTAYRALLAELPLSGTHRENLRRRGLTDAETARIFPITRSRTFRIVQAAFDKAGIPRPERARDRVGAVHILRHSGAIARLQAMGNPKAVQDQLRHKSAAMTLRYLKTLSADESLRIQQKVELW